MTFEPYETIEEHGYTIQIVNDMSPMSPREWDQLGHMLCWHPDYMLGDEQFRSPDDVGGARNMKEVAEFIRDERGGINIIPLYLYDHSGITMWAGETIEESVPDINGRNINPFDTAGWDTSAVGFIYTTDELIEKLGAPRDNLDKALRAEVKEYDDFLTGNVWGYVITKVHECGVIECPHSETVDACWGFIGDPKDALEEAREALPSAETSAATREVRT